MSVVDVPSPQNGKELWAEADREQAYWTDHYAQLLRKYPEQFVAVQNGRVVAHDSDLPAIVTKLEQAGIEPTQAWVRFITRDPTSHRW
jgi:hypothetical protein